MQQRIIIALGIIISACALSAASLTKTEPSGITIGQVIETAINTNPEQSQGVSELVASL
ncbi:Uncharacterised protein [Corynebacterium kutscheri]|uniref:Secreted protein n=1 Tax=Corynebacterium kutscheri TaxID=35755 RepID=A0A0F6QYR6_9CORY|nr:hypothetical protein [Corynebacterium kutscheri]AKE40310.1 hypothetical protein UL82_00335 [Corynebacterium kutscheri]VEH05464.1 Uncharacterised protein [Corynebacterium kutscheri]VEH10703.1 Uncharacterised protein [Corynebacterium kutscheri]VEH81350.1 Uncharacterised protein [Corynebacterium kutscheri]